MAPNEGQPIEPTRIEPAPLPSTREAPSGLNSAHLSRFGAVLLGVLAAGEAKGGEFAIIETNVSSASPDLVQADLDAGTNTTIDGSRTSIYEGATDCEFIPEADRVVCSTGRSSGVDQGLMVIDSPTGTPTVTYETPGDYEWAWKINHDAAGEVISWTSTDGATTNKIWWADSSSGLSTSDANSCDVTGDSPIAVAVDTTDSNEPYALVANNGDGTLEIIRLSDCTSMYVAYTVPSHATPGLTYPYVVALDRDNDIGYVASDTSTTIIEIDTSDLSTPFDQGIIATTATVYDLALIENPTTGSRELWTAEVNTTNNYIGIYNAGDVSSTSNITTISNSGRFSSFDEYSPLAISENGDLVYVSTGAGDGIYAIDTSTYALSTTAGPYNVGGSPGPLAIAWTVTAAEVDDDGDGISVDDGDCDDGDPTVGLATTRYEDNDGDGYGSTTSATVCPDVSGYSGTSDDCDDTDATVFPGAPEVCDGDLEDCDGTVDAGTTSTYYRDADSDGYGIGSGVEACGPDGLNTATVAGDCDDANNLAYPGAAEATCVMDASEIADLNCDSVEPEVCEDDEDLDGDGEIATTQGGTDCDDGNPDVNSAATEDCTNGIDDDCDTLTDSLDTEDCGTSTGTDDGDCVLEEGETVTVTPDRCSTLYLDYDGSPNYIAEPSGTFSWEDYARITIDSLEADGIVVKEDHDESVTVEVEVTEGSGMGIRACRIGFEKNGAEWSAWTIDENDDPEHWFDLRLPTLNEGNWVERAAMEGEEVVVEADGTLNEEQTTGSGACAQEGVDCEAEENPGDDTGTPSDDTGEQPHTGETPEDDTGGDTPEQPDDGCGGCNTGAEGSPEAVLAFAATLGLLRRRKEETLASLQRTIEGVFDSIKARLQQLFS